MLVKDVLFPRARTAEKKSDPLRKVPSIFSIVPSDDPVETSLRIAHELVGQPLSASLEGLKTILQDTE